MISEQVREPADCAIRYGNSLIIFQIKYSKRKTLAIHVHPDASVSVTAPNGSDIEKIKSKILKRAKWIKKQQRLFARFPPVLPARRYVSGESFRYLGHQYVLKVERAIACQVKIDRNRLLVRSTYLAPAYVKEHVDSWYKKRAGVIFHARLEACLSIVKKIGISYEKNVSIRPMKSRWGSCSRDGRITLNPELICAGKDCIDYVILHELCHVKIYNHGPTFYKLLSKALPDWERRKEKLETSMEQRFL